MRNVCVQFILDTAAGAWAILHTGFAVLGFVVVCAFGVAFFRPDLLQQSEQYLLERLAADQSDRPRPAQNVPAVPIESEKLDSRQRAVVAWLAKRYGLALAPTAVLVLEAHKVGLETKLDPYLILAVAAIESNFHPFIQSEAGAQGLMQVMPQVHRKRYEALGKSGMAAFDPLVNMRVGAYILRDFIQLHKGDQDAGLRAYLGGFGQDEDDGGYVGKVRAELLRIRQAADSAPSTAPPATGGLTGGLTGDAKGGA